MDKKFAIFGDIHSNIVAFDAVLEDARSRGVTDFLCVGDVVGYNASPVKCIKRIRELGCITIRGNHDHYCSSPDVCLDDFQPLAASVIEWTRRQLSEDDQRWLRGLPLNKSIAGAFQLVHGTLDNPQDWGYVFDALSAEASFSYQNVQICFHGHTHVPIIYRKHNGMVERDEPGPEPLKLAFGKKYFINVGSVGQPRDGDPRSSYVIYDHKEKIVEFVRVEYDVAAVQRQILDAGLPERLANRLAAGR